MEQIIPEIGWYKKIPDQIYHRQWDACNASRLSDFAISAEYCLHKIKNPTEGESDDLVLGTACHTAVLEHDYFEDRYVQEPLLEDLHDQPQTRGANSYKYARRLVEAGVLNAVDWITPAFSKLKKDEREGVILDIITQEGGGPKKKILTADQWETCMRVRERLLREPSAARDLVENFDETEVSVVADDPETGVRVKVRPDGVLSSTGLIADLKTTRNIETRSFARDMYTFGYFRSAPYYVDACNWLHYSDGNTDELWKHHVFLVVEKTPPFQTVVLDLDPRHVDLGRRSYRHLLNRYAECERTHEWPGLPNEVISISLPPWAEFQEEERIA